MPLLSEVLRVCRGLSALLPHYVQQYKAALLKAAPALFFPFLRSSIQVPVILHWRLVTQLASSEEFHAPVCVRAIHKIAQLEGSVAGVAQFAAPAGEG